MQPKKLDISPHVNLLRSLRADRFNPVSLLGEAIDNSLDAQAQTVTATVGDDEIVFSDDGCGIDRDRMCALFSLGRHGPMDSTKLGRFGVGITSQAVNAGDVLEVISISKDGKYLASVNWRSLLLGGKWEIDAPTSQPVAVNSRTHTTITIRSLRKHSRFVEETACAQLAQIFHPALCDGRKIVLNGVSVAALQDPPMTDLIDETLSLSGGRSARLRAGILVGPSKLNRVHVQYKHRVIMPASTVGCGQYSGLTKMFARLAIDGPWYLGKFKDDLPSDAEREELEEAVERLLRPILEKCASDTMSAKLNRFEGMLNDALPEDLKTARPHHKGKEPNPNPDRKKRVEKGFVDSAESDPAGSPARTRGGNRNRLRITFDGDFEQHGVGVLVPGRPYRVDLSKDDPFVKALLARRDEELPVRCLLALALAIYEHDSRRDELEFGDFGKRLSLQLSAQGEPSQAQMVSA